MLGRSLSHQLRPRRICSARNVRVLLVVHGVAQAPYSGEVLTEVISAGERIGGHGWQPAESRHGRFKTVGWPKGEQHLTHRSTVAENTRSTLARIITGC